MPSGCPAAAEVDGLVGFIWVGSTAGALADPLSKSPKTLASAASNHATADVGRQVRTGTRRHMWCWVKTRRRGRALASSSGVRGRLSLGYHHR